MAIPFFMYNSNVRPAGFLIMGVSGSGKSTLGKALAKRLEWDFFDADDFHPAENISRMAAGIPLSDSDRAPWLAALNRQLTSSLAAGRHPVLACSALKESYRTQLLSGVKDVAILYLKGDYDAIRHRLLARKGHYMKADLLQSQFEALEEPEDAISLDAMMPHEELLAVIIQRYPSLGGKSNHGH